MSAGWPCPVCTPQGEPQANAFQRCLWKWEACKARAASACQARGGKTTASTAAQAAAQGPACLACDGRPCGHGPPGGSAQQPSQRLFVQFDVHVVQIREQAILALLGQVVHLEAAPSSCNQHLGGRACAAGRCGARIRGCQSLCWLLDGGRHLVQSSYKRCDACAQRGDCVRRRWDCSARLVRCPWGRWVHVHGVWWRARLPPRLPPWSTSCVPTCHPGCHPGAPAVCSPATQAATRSISCMAGSSYNRFSVASCMPCASSSRPATRRGRGAGGKEGRRSQGALNHGAVLRQSPHPLPRQHVQ